jgi:hypothetical protein
MISGSLREMKKLKKELLDFLGLNRRLRKREGLMRQNYRLKQKVKS